MRYSLNQTALTFNQEFVESGFDENDTPSNTVNYVQTTQHKYPNVMQRN